MIGEKKVVTFTYKNYKGEIAVRTAEPRKWWFGESPYHKGRQWFMRAFDQEKGQTRDFALADCDFTNHPLPPEVELR